MPDEAIDRVAKQMAGGGFDLEDDPFSKAVKDFASTRNTKLRSSMLSGSAVDPDKRAKATDLGSLTGTPAPVVERNMPEIERRAKFNSIDFEGLQKNAPEVARFLSDPENAAVAHDDIDALTRAVDLVRSPFAGIVSVGQAIGGLGDINQAFGESIVSLLPGELQTSFREFDKRVTESVPDAIQNFINPTRVLRRAGGEFRAAAEFIRPPVQRQTFLTQVAEGLGQFAGQAAAFILSGGTLGTVILLGQGADIQGQRADAEGASPEAKALGVIGGAIVTAATERAGIAFILRKIPEPAQRALKKSLVDIFISGGAEALQEVTEGIGQNLITQTLIDPNQPILQGVEQDFTVSGTVGAVARGLVLAATRGKGVGRRIREADTAIEDAGKLSGLVEAAAESKLRKRLPEKFEELIRNAASGNGTENVFIPAKSVQEYFQTIEDDPFELTDDLGVTDQYDEALATGGDLVVPVEKFASVFADSKHTEALLPHSRLNADGISLTEADAFNEQAREAIDLAVQETQQEVARQEGLLDADIQIENQLFQQIRETGQPIDASRLQAQFLTAFFRTTAERTGRDISEVFGDENLRIERVLPETLTAEGVDLDALIKMAKERQAEFGLEAEDAPSKRAAFGKTLLDFAREMGVRDDRGDLAGQDVDKTTKTGGPKKPFQRNLLRDDGASIDDVALAAQEAGFFPEIGGDQRVDINQFIDAITEEISGTPRFSEALGSEELIAERQAVDDLIEALGRQGVGLDEDTETIKEALAQTEPGDLGQRGPIRTVDIPDSIIKANDAMDRASEKLGGFTEEPGPGVTGETRVTNPQQQAAVTRANNRIGKLIRDEFPGISIQDTIAIRTALQNGEKTADITDVDAAPLFQPGTISSISFKDEGVVTRTADPINSAEFKNWFKDSKVVDDDGKPLVVFHSTTAKFEEFKRQHEVGSFGFHFGSIEAAEKRFEVRDLELQVQGILDDGERQIIPVFLSIQNPLRLDENRTGRWAADDVMIQIRNVFQNDGDIEGFSEEDIDGFFEDEIIRDGVNYFDLTNDREIDVEEKQDFVKGYLADRGYDGIVYNNKFEGGGDSFIAFEPTQIKATENRGTFDSRDPRILFQIGKIGSISFKDEGVVIRLTEASNMSTLLHESGHMFLETYRQLADKGAATPEIQTDIDTISAWFADNAQQVFDWIKNNNIEAIPEIEKRGGVDYVREIGSKMQLDRPDTDPAAAAVATSYHELWARTVESYLFEGKAPSIQLQDAFSRFRAWLVSVYRKVRNLEGVLSDDIRAVMDRMLATDAEIADAQQANLYIPMAEVMDVMTDAELRAYNESAQRATGEAEQELAQKALSELRRENKKWWKDELAQVREIVADEVNSRPVYNALWFLRRGMLFTGQTPTFLVGKKLSRPELVNRYGAEILELLPKGVPPLWRKSGGVTASTLAELVGMKSDDALVKALINAPPPKGVIDAEAQRIMLERHGDLMNDGSIEEEAQRAVHSDQRANFLTTELRALSRRSNEQFTAPADVIKAAAKRAINEKSVDQVLKAGQFLKAEQRAARAAQEAVIAKNFKEAADQKRKQLINHHLYLGARKAGEQVNKDLAFMNGFLKRGAARMKIDHDYLLRIQSVLSAFNIGPRLSDLKRTRLELRALNDWMIAKEQDDNAEFIITGEIQEADARGVTHFRNMTLNEFNGLRDTIKNIETQGRNKLKFATNLKARTLAEAVTELNDSARSSVAERKAVVKEDIQQNRDTIDNFMEFTRGLDASFIKMEQVTEWLDGGFGGPWRDLIFDRIAEAEGVEDTMNKEFMAKIITLFDVVPKETSNKWNSEKHSFAGMGEKIDPATGQRNVREFTRGDIIAMALNVGNDGNLTKLLQGYAWTQAQADNVLDVLTKEEWQFVQNIWDTIDGLWPDIVALEKRVTGVPPIKVEARKVQTKFGEFEGGYYPVVYDAHRSQRAKIIQERQGVNKLFETGYTSAITGHGHTIERTGFTGPLNLNISVIPRHVAQVIHDLTHRETVIAIHKVLNDKTVREAISDTLGPEFHEAMVRWNKDVANGRISDEASLEPIEKIARGARINLSAATMGLKMSTFIQQPIGITQTMDVLRNEKNYKRILFESVVDFYNPTKMAKIYKFAKEKSVVIRFRLLNNDRDIQAGIRSLSRTAGKGRIKQAQVFSLMSIGIGDLMVSVPSWMAGYKIGLIKFDGDDAKAVSFADRTVRLSQGAAGLKDLSQIQRGGKKRSEFVKSSTVFFGYFNILWARLRDAGLTRRKLREVDKPKYFARYLMLIFIPAIVSDLVSGRGPDDDEDELEWAIRKVLLYPALAVPFLRDVAAGVDFVLSGRGGGGGGVTPLGRATDEFVQLARQFEQGDLDRAAIKALIDAGGVAGLPAAQQVKITGEYMYDYFTGEEDEFSTRDLFFSRPPKGKR